MNRLTGVLVLLTGVVSTLFSNEIRANTTIFDGTNIKLSNSGSLIGSGNAGDHGGTEIRLGWNPFAVPVGYDASFGNSDFTPTAGNILNPVIIPASETHIAVTALQNPLNATDFRSGDVDPNTPGQDPAVYDPNNSVLRVFMTEVNPNLNFNDGGTPGNPSDDVWTILKEIYIYDFNSTAFGPSDPNEAYTTLSKNIETGWAQMTLLVDVYSDPALYNGPLTVPTPDIALNAFAAVIPPGTPGFSPDFDTLGVFQTGFQTPTSDGQLDGSNTVLVDLEIDLVQTIVPEPSTVGLAFIAISFGLVRRNRIV